MYVTAIVLPSSLLPNPAGLALPWAGYLGLVGSRCCYCWLLQLVRLAYPATTLKFEIQMPCSMHSLNSWRPRALSYMQAMQIVAIKKAVFLSNYWNSICMCLSTCQCKRQKNINSLAMEAGYST